MKKYFFFDGTNQHGPFTLEELRAYNITPQTSVWFDSIPQWKPAGEIPELQVLFNNTAAAPGSAPAVSAQGDWNSVDFYYMDGSGKQVGPFKLSQLAGKNITAQTQVWYAPLPNWTTAGQVAALSSVINSVQAAVSPAAASQAVQATTQQTGWEHVGFYYIDASGIQQGPLKLNQLAGRNITAQTQVWYESLTKWVTAGEVPVLSSVISAASSVSTSQPAQAATQQTGWEHVGFYYIDSTGKQQGPLKISQLAGRNITAQTQVWYESLTKWVTAGEVPALSGIISSAAAAAPAQTATQQTGWEHVGFYYIDGSGTQQGPFKLNQLAGKNITAQTQVWHETLPNWTTAGQIPVLKQVIESSQTIAQPQATTAQKAATEDWSKKQFFISDAGGQQQGPFTLSQLEGKDITESTSVWYDPLTEWTTAEKVPALKTILDAVKARMEEWKNKFYFFTDATGTRQGPFKLDQLKDKNITAQTPVWYDPLTEWTTAEKVTALRDIISQ